MHTISFRIVRSKPRSGSSIKCNTKQHVSGVFCCNFGQMGLRDSLGRSGRAYEYRGRKLRRRE
jgi:hypothetical protein